MRTGWSISFRSRGGRPGDVVEGPPPREASQPRVNPAKMARFISNLMQGRTNSLNRRAEPG